MCGIVGMVGATAGRHSITELTDLLAHRGPDDSGVFEDEGVALGHRRLSILDLSDAGHQPMHHGDLTIVYNGEIYNFRELRRGLPGPFRSQSDTEVLLHLFAQEGPAFVHRLVGMFAFAIWDRRRQVLFCARDRLGIKPLLYREVDGGVAFASELKALVAMGRPRVRQSALRDFFSYKYIPTPKTIYRDIFKLPPAHTLTYRRREGSLRIERYWTPVASTEITDADEALERFEPLLARVINDHTLSDVPIGVFLSGGIDSTTLVANLDRPRTFTLGFDRGRDESQYARQVARHFAAEHHEETARGVDLEEALDRIPRIYDEPFGDHGAWPTFLVSRLARQMVKVAMTGEGGDELFAGYQWYYKWLHFRSTVASRLLAASLPPLWQTSRTFQRRAASGVERFSMFLGPFTLRQKAALLSPDLTTAGYDDLWYFRQHWRRDLEPVKRMQWADLHTYLVDDMLPKVDRASMANSLEARPPLLDHRLVEFVLTLNGRLLRDERKGKVIVRRHLAGRVPPNALTRGKIGFSMPVRRWVQRQPALLRAALDRLHRRGVLRSARRYNFNSEQAWSLLVLDRWLEQTGAVI